MPSGKNKADGKKNVFDPCREKRGRRFLLRLLLLTAALFSALSLTLAWFVNRQDAEAGSAELDADGILCLLIRDDEGGALWSAAVDMEDRVPEPLAGNGRQFFMPLQSLSETAAADLIGNRLKGPVISGYAAVTDLPARALVRDFRLKYPEDVCLTISAESRLTAGDAENAPPETRAAAGAFRLAILEKTGLGWTLRAIWFPNPEAELEGSRNGGWTFTEEGSPEEGYFLADGVDGAVLTGRTLETAGRQYFRENEEGPLYIWDLTAGIPFAQLKKNRESTFRLILWPEGTDRECQGPSAGGSVRLDLRLKAE